MTVNIGVLYVNIGVLYVNIGVWYVNIGVLYVNIGVLYIFFLSHNYMYPYFQCNLTITNIFYNQRSDMRKPMETMCSSGLEWAEKSHGKKELYSSLQKCPKLIW